MKIARVVANPYAAVDADGVPQGVVGVPGTRGIYVGARIDSVASQKTGKQRFYFPPAKDGGLRIVELNVSSAYARSYVASCILEGGLIAVDEATATAVGISPKNFLPADRALEVERVRALELYRVVYGKDAVLQPIPTEQAPAEETPSEDAPSATPSTDVASSRTRLVGAISLITPSEK